MTEKLIPVEHYSVCRRKDGKAKRFSFYGCMDWILHLRTLFIFLDREKRRRIFPFGHCFTRTPKTFCIRRLSKTYKTSAIIDHRNLLSIYGMPFLKNTYWCNEIRIFKTWIDFTYWPCTYTRNFFSRMPNTTYYYESD